MFIANYASSNQKDNYVAYDYAYNLLQSCENNAVLITNGDNDTFPLWYLQNVEGIRRDIRIVNLTLLNTSWYALQLKHNSPYGAEPVPFLIDGCGIGRPAARAIPTANDRDPDRQRNGSKLSQCLFFYIRRFIGFEAGCV